MSLPQHVRLVEVGPRDGLQNEARPITLAQRVELVDRLSAAGLNHIETGSFVSPRWVPQMADSAAVFDGIQRRPGVCYSALVPNLRYGRHHHGQPRRGICLRLRVSQQYQLTINENATLRPGRRWLERAWRYAVTCPACYAHDGPRPNRSQRPRRVAGDGLLRDSWATPSAWRPVLPDS